VLVRYLTGEPPDLAERAAALIDSDRQLRVPIIALVESAYVLTHSYGVERAVVVDTLLDFCTRANVTPHELPTERVVEALRLCRPSNRVSFTDAFIWATAATAQAQVFTFDRRFPALDIDRQLLA
jgi:predicted nucleic acid-binding protein